MKNAGLDFDVLPVAVDEETIKQSLIAEEVSPRDISDALAEAKSLKASAKCPGSLVLGCDQVLECDGKLLSKPKSVEDSPRKTAFITQQTSHVILCGCHFRRRKTYLATHLVKSDCLCETSLTPIWMHNLTGNLG